MGKLRIFKTKWFQRFARDEEKEFKEAARQVLALTEKQLAELVNQGDFVEVKNV